MRNLLNVALRREAAIIRVLFFLAPFVTLMAPKTTVPVLIALFIGCTLLALAHGARLNTLFRVDLGLALFAVATAYLFVNASWSLDPSRALGKAAWFGLVAAMSIGAWRALASWPKPQIGMAAAAFLAGLFAIVVFLLVETLTDRFLTVSLYNLVPVTRPESIKGLVVKNGEIVRIAAFGLNHNVAVMLLALWPAILCIVTKFAGPTRWIGVAALLLATVTAVLLSEHDSSKAGLILSVLAFAAALAWPIWTQRAVWAGWCLAFVLVVPLTTLAYKAELHHADWLDYSAKARVVLWAYTAEQIPAAPILGIGASSTRKMDLDRQERLEAIEAKPKGATLDRRAGAHAHNAFLQTWYELGAVGVILFMAAGAAVIGSVGRLPRPTQSYILAHVAAFLTVVAFGWGMWQSWLMALAGLASLYAALAANFYRARHDDAVATRS